MHQPCSAASPVKRNALSVGSAALLAAAGVMAVQGPAVLSSDPAHAAQSNKRLTPKKLAKKMIKKHNRVNEGSKGKNPDARISRLKSVKMTDEKFVYRGKKKVVDRSNDYSSFLDKQGSKVARQRGIDPVLADAAKINIRNKKGKPATAVVKFSRMEGPHLKKAKWQGRHDGEIKVANLVTPEDLTSGTRDAFVAKRSGEVDIDEVFGDDFRLGYAAINEPAEYESTFDYYIRTTLGSADSTRFISDSPTGNAEEDTIVWTDGSTNQFAEYPVSPRSYMDTVSSLSVQIVDSAILVGETVTDRSQFGTPNRVYGDLVTGRSEASFDCDATTKRAVESVSLQSSFSGDVKVRVIDYC